ncbi:MAG: ATP-binding protein [Vicinamibacteria bacterium]|nr:ATP-binding protein [Vicinamibacteria bacterium]
MKLRIGPPATGDNFYKRPALIKKLLRILEGSNVAFLGPRRTGKTSCLEEIKSHPGQFLPILLNLEKHDTVEAWLSDMLTELRKALAEPKGPVARLADETASLLAGIQKIELSGIGGVEMAKSQAKAAWRKSADEFLELLVRSDVPVLFLLDEFPTFLKLVAKHRSRDEVEAVLNWFRAARHDLKDKQVRFLVTGSIGLKGVVRNLGLAPSINEFDAHEIPPLSDVEAMGLLATLAKDIRVPLDAKGQKKILRLLGANWPILLQLFISEIEEAEFKKPPTAGQLEAIYLERLVNGSRNQYCDGMFDRLKDAFTEAERRLAREILKAVCRSIDGLGREEFDRLHEKLEPVLSQTASGIEELDHVLDTLKHDGYLLQESAGQRRTRFGSNILRDFWLRKTA